MKVDQTSYVPHLVEGRSSFVETDVSLALLQCQIIEPFGSTDNIEDFPALTMKKRNIKMPRTKQKIFHNFIVKH